MLKTAIFPGRYVQGEGALDHLGSEAAKLGDSGLAILDEFAMENLKSRIEATLKGAGSYTLSKFGGECSDEEINLHIDEAKASSAKVIIGIGGGKGLDVAKAVAHNLGLPVINVPTLASTDAPTSALSVIYTPSGEFDRYMVLPRNPNVILVDSKIIAEAPVRFFKAGIADALATYFEAEDCRPTQASNMTGNTGPMTAHGLAKLCYNVLLEDGVSACTACSQGVVVPALDNVIEANTLLSGLGFESGGLAAAHAIHNGLTMLDETHHYYHGEKVSIGVLSQLWLTGRPRSLIDEVYEFCRAIGLPTTLKEIGLEKVTDEQLKVVADRACEDGETIHNTSFAVTPDMVIAAIKVADAEGQRLNEVGSNY
ncbi:glycerol dehydrogenase [Sedimentitalea sp. XS_ASV28]|uniref:glycerol dehydrogenase n=1 Tax=Sedimentitalea sp. XS_ASV28 TaxID=3241296 RepID=UPI0035136A65